MNEAFAKELLEIAVEGYENGVEALIPRISKKRRNKFPHDVVGAASTICFEKYKLCPQELNETMRYVADRVNDHVLNGADIGIDLKGYELLIKKGLDLINIAINRQNAIVENQELIEDTMRLIAKKMLSLVKEDNLEGARALAEKIRKLCHNI